MKLYKIILTATYSLLFLGACSTKESQMALVNAEGTIKVEVSTDLEGRPYYQLFYRDSLVLDTSFLGLKLSKRDLSKGLSLSAIDTVESVSDVYTMRHGKQQELHYKAQRYVATFVSEKGDSLECHFNLSTNGFAYRYKIQDPGGDEIVIQSENSAYRFPSSTKAWMQPMSTAKSGWSETNPSYEEHYQMEVPVDHLSPLGEGYVYPALFKSGQTWVLISETNLHENYCGTRLQYDEKLKALRVTFPQEEEIFPGGGLLPSGQQPFVSPWRTVAIGNLKDIVANTLGTDLAAPAIDMDTDFVESGLATWSWALLKDNSVNFDTTQKFIDYAADMNWPYCLIDVNWDTRIGYDKIKTLVDYAASKNVGLLLWYNSSGDWNSTQYTPKDIIWDDEQRRAEFKRISEMGVAGVKIDFFGGDGQSMIAYYHDILKDAAANRLLVNFHGATLPRGWQRTYPNLMTVEAIKGEEFVTFEQANADMQPSHCAVLPFTRNVYDPMDLTPMVLDSIPNIERRTATTFELALPVLFTSGIQHIAEIPEGMDKMPKEVVSFLRSVPTQWDESRFLQGYPGKEVVLARRKGTTWYVVGINGEAMAKTWRLDLSFVGHDEGMLFWDDQDGNSQIKKVFKNPTAVEVQPYGGFVIKI